MTVDDAEPLAPCDPGAAPITDCARCAVLERDLALARQQLARAEVTMAGMVEALGRARTIGAAVGIVMSALTRTQDEAFAYLVKVSQRLHVRVRELAEEIVLTGAVPELPVSRRNTDRQASAP
ncbi:MAG: ANTAR domain-containing protein [Jatrophihabitans sp.]|uniref:ANTAR domain-containing protein n=1 Tax=Jatrophihabitans sp. TaxID=1932789 RepID=UPI003F80DA6D